LSEKLTERNAAFSPPNVFIKDISGLRTFRILACLLLDNIHIHFLREILMTLRPFTNLLACLAIFASTSVFAAPLVVDVTGIQSNGELGASGNTVLTFDVGANSTITTIDYSVNLTAFDPSYLSEISLSFTNSDMAGVFFTPAFGDDFSGTGMYADAADLVASGLSFNVGADGILRLEFYEGFDDFPGADGQWNFGTITFGVTQAVTGDVPEPGTTALFGAGLALLGYASRRRRPQ
jgi:hypothetical protein